LRLWICCIEDWFVYYERIVLQEARLLTGAVSAVPRMEMRRRTWKQELFMVAAAVLISFAAHGQEPKQAPQVSADADEHIPYSQPRDLALAEPQALIESHRYSEAAEKIHTYLQSHPDSAAAHFLLGYTLYRENMPRQSLAEYTLGARFQNPAASDLAAVAMDYILLQDYQDADKWLTEATTLSKDSELYCYYLGRTKYVENRFNDAIEVFRKCLTLSPHDLRAEYNLGLAYAGAGQIDQATTAYQTAIAWQQSSGVPDPQPYLDFGVMLLEHGKPDQALPLLQKAVALGPQNPRAHEQLGKTWKLLRNLPNADAEMQAAIRLAPDVSALHFEMGRIFQLEGLTAKAKEEFDRCSALNASHSTESAATPNLPPRD
jgi:Flp pilus assembly protein TadD